MAPSGPLPAGPWETPRLVWAVAACLTLAVLMREGTVRVVTHRPRGPRRGPGSATARAGTASSLLGPSPPSPSAQALCRGGQRPTLLPLSAPPWKRGDAEVNKVRHRRAAIPPLPPCQLPLGQAPGWPGGAQQAGTQRPALQVTDTQLPHTPAARKGQGTPSPPTHLLGAKARQTHAHSCLPQGPGHTRPWLVVR